MESKQTLGYPAYTSVNHSVWSILYTRQFRAVKLHAYAFFAEGLRQLALNDSGIPDFNEINKRLLELTGWQLYGVPGLIPNRDFFEAMANRRFGATNWIRPMEELNYLEEPDLFHDVFGHVPLLADPIVADYLVALARIAERYLDNEAAIEAIARLYWYTIEFGLVLEPTGIKIYGAGILSSIGETAFCMSGAANLAPFDLARVLKTPYIKDKFQEQYFVLESIGQLSEIARSLDQRLKYVKIN